MKAVCLITGAGGRLGQELCRQLSGKYNVIAAYRKRAPDSQHRQSISFGDHIGFSNAASADNSVYAVQADLADRGDIRRLVEVGMARFGQIDYLVNSAADLRYHGKLLELWQADDYAQSTMNLNAISPMLLTSAVFEHCWKASPPMNSKANRGVINVSSISGLQVYPSNSAFYAASKAAMNILTLFLSLELAPYSVRANAICPGRFDDVESTAKVARSVRSLMEGMDSGKIITDI